jgi:hypothetical protein
MAPPKRWPSSIEEKDDRARILEMVYVVGWERLRWNVYHLRAASTRRPEWELKKPAQLARHLKDLTGSTLMVVGRRAAFSADESQVRGGKQIYALTCRASELDATPAELDDMEKAYAALWVATRALARSAVPTTTVTAVLQSIEDLAPESDRQTSALLKSLHLRSKPLVRQMTRSGDRTSWWEPLGSLPDHPTFARWVADFGRLNPDPAVVASTGHATLSGMVSELVAIAVDRSKSSSWPQGHPVSIRSIRATAGQDPRADELMRRLERMGKRLGTVLGDVTKRRLGDGHPRRHVQVMKVGSLLGSGTYYDVETIPGAEQRRLYLTDRELRETLTSETLHQWRIEFCEADALTRHGNAAVQACGWARMVGVHREAARMGKLVNELRRMSTRLSAPVRARTQTLVGRLEEFHAEIGSRAEATRRAEEAFARVRLSLKRSISAPRPLIRADEYADLVPQHFRRGLSPALYLACSTTLTRYPNPNHKRRGSSDPEEAAILCVDRVEALAHVTLLRATGTASFLQSGRDLLGRTVRDPKLVHRVLASADAAGRSAAIAALTLLGDDSTEAAAWAMVENPGSSGDEVVSALMSLLILQRLGVTRIPKHLRQPSDPWVRRHLPEIVLAAHQKRWLLER